MHVLYKRPVISSVEFLCQYLVVSLQAHFVTLFFLFLTVVYTFVVDALSSNPELLTPDKTVLIISSQSSSQTHLLSLINFLNLTYCFFYIYWCNFYRTQLLFLLILLLSLLFISTKRLFYFMTAITKKFSLAPSDHTCITDLRGNPPTLYFTIQFTHAVYTHLIFPTLFLLFHAFTPNRTLNYVYFLNMEKLFNDKIQL